MAGYQKPRGEPGGDCCGIRGQSENQHDGDHGENLIRLSRVVCLWAALREDTKALCMLQARQDGLDKEHHDQGQGQPQADGLLPVFRPFPRHSDATDLEEFPTLHRLIDVLGPVIDQRDHVEQVHDQPADKGRDPLLEGACTFHILEHGLADHEDPGSADEGQLPSKKPPVHQVVPNEVTQLNEDGMNRDLWILQLHDAAHRIGELPVFINQQVLQVVVHASVAIHDNSRPPNHAVQHRPEELRRINRELPHDIRMPLEQIVQTVIVPGTICTDCHKILQHHLGGLQVPSVYGHVQRRDGLGADRDIQNPHRSVRTWSIRQRTPYLLGIVCVDGLHDESRTLLDGPHQELGN
mmetsp:Transcript_51100/g.119783  ORF Transcript_51100/g.119783 Transcript_51100/m.119783 type:complete len:352 (+) Transcript_51100:862-1917(+)